MDAESLQKQAEADPDAFERAHGKIAYAAYKLAEKQYTDGGRVLFRRSHLRDLCRENWPAFVAEAAAS